LLLLLVTYYNKLAIFVLIPPSNYTTLPTRRAASLLRPYRCLCRCRKYF